MKRQYKKRTLEEAEEIAQEHFRAAVKDNLSENLIQELESDGIRSSGYPSSQWQNVLGYIPDKKMHYEFILYKPSASIPFAEKLYARILVSRNRDSEFCKIVWLPEWQESEGYIE